MKTIILAILMCLSLQIHAQSVDSTRIIKLDYTTQDTVKVVMLVKQPEHYVYGEKTSLYYEHTLITGYAAFTERTTKIHLVDQDSTYIGAYDYDVIYYDDRWMKIEVQDREVVMRVIADWKEVEYFEIYDWIN